ncbi:MAG: DUF1330 domain-containing protein [Rhodospirillaceae bacterium]|nr:DUF1330 domain-containing protein [Rhodospirillaceae bacterium]
MALHRIATLMLSLTLVAGGAARAESETGAASPQVSPKPGYMVVIGVGVDPSRMGAYAAAAVPLLLKYRGRLLFATDEGRTEVLEGGPFPGSVRVFEFPSLQSARDFYYSAEYQAAIPLRAGNGKLDVIVSDAFVPDPKWFAAPPAAR